MRKHKKLEELMVEKNRTVLEARDIGQRVTKDFKFILVYFATTATNLA